jgi:hypothetical protein
MYIIVYDKMGQVFTSHNKRYTLRLPIGRLRAFSRLGRSPSARSHASFQLHFTVAGLASQALIRNRKTSYT